MTSICIFFIEILNIAKINIVFYFEILKILIEHNNAIKLHWYTTITF